MGTSDAHMWKSFISEIEYWYDPKINTNGRPGTWRNWRTKSSEILMNFKWKYFRVTGPLWGEFSQRLVAPSFNVSCDVHLNNWLSKQSICWWFETPWRSLWRHSHAIHTSWRQWQVIAVQLCETILLLWARNTSLKLELGGLPCWGCQDLPTEKVLSSPHHLHELEILCNWIWPSSAISCLLPGNVVLSRASEGTLVSTCNALKFELRNNDDVIKWKHFPCCWPFVRRIHRSQVNSTSKCQWHEALLFSFICAWTNGWVNNRDAGDSRRHRAQYGVTVMWHCSLYCFGTSALQTKWVVYINLSTICLYLYDAAYYWPFWGGSTVSGILPH